MTGILQGFCLLLLTVLSVRAQSLIDSKAELAWMNGSEKELKTPGRIVFNKASRMLSIQINMAPLVGNKALADSLTREWGNLDIKIQSEFPELIENYTATDDEKNLNREATIAIRDSTQKAVISFIFKTLRDKNSMAPSGYETNTVPARLNCAIKLDLDQFGLTSIFPFRKRWLLVELENGIINKI